MLSGALLLFVAAIVAFWLSAICGGGASLLLVPLLHSLLPPSLAPWALTIGTCSSSVSRIAFFFRHIRWDVVAWFVPASLPGVAAGAYLLKYVQPLYLQIVVAALLLANVPMMLRRGEEAAESGPPPARASLALIGFVAGFVSGVTGAIGLLFNRFYLRGGLDKNEIVATRAANEICLHLVKLAIYLALGFSSRAATLFGLVIAAGAVVSTITVRWLLPRIPDGLFRRIGYGAMVLSGMALLFSSARAIVRQDRVSYVSYREGGTTEWELGWRSNELVLEFSFDEGFDIEQRIEAGELPPEPRAAHDALRPGCDAVIVERVHRYRRPVSYEFYCWKGQQVTRTSTHD